MKEKIFYITTPIYYVNDKPHLGHAYTTIKTDVIARWKRLGGEKVFFSTGTDEHGLKIQRRAEEVGKSPQSFVGEISGQFKDFWRTLDISYDGFIRTTDENHKKVVERVLAELSKKGAIYKGIYKGLYCLGCEQFLTEPQLIEGKCPDHNIVPEVVEEKNYLLKMTAVQDKLIEKIKSDEFKITPQARKNEILNFLSQKLEDISISRDKKRVSWGIELPFDTNQVTYVWVDAFLNYLTVLGWDGDPKNIPEPFPPDVQFLAKDIFRVHATVWPAILLHLNLPLPKELYVHGFILSGGRKMSKTLGNIIDPYDLIEQYGKDALRYYLLREISSFDDGDITEEKFKEAYNANLANGLGNLVARIMKMSEEHFGLGNPVSKGKPGFPENYKRFMDRMELNKAMDVIWDLISELDLKIQKTQPFKLINTDKEKAKEILKELVFGLHQVALLLQPFLPSTSEKIIQAIKANKMPETIFPRK